MPGFLTELKRRNVVRVAVAYVAVAWVVAQVFDLAADNFGAPDWVMKLLLVLLVAGLPVALILAWAFDLTPEGVKRSKQVPASESITAHTGRTLKRITTAALILALAFIAWDKFGGHVLPRNDVITDKSVAVLPFADLSENQDQEWFADGLTEEILNALARLPELKVTARTSSFAFKNTSDSIGDIADKLGVAHIVEGSVRRVGTELRVTVQLVRANDGFHLWSDTYDRATDELLDVQREVAERIAATLDVLLDHDKRAYMSATGTRDVAAFEAFMRGRDLFRKAHRRDPLLDVTLADANAYFEQAISLDPGYARAAILHADRFAHFLIEGPVSIVGDVNGLDADSAYAQLQRDHEFAVDKAPDPLSRLVAELNQEFFAPHWHRMPALIQRLDELIASGAAMPRETGWVHEILLLSGSTDLAASFASDTTVYDPLAASGWVDLIESLVWQRRLDEAIALIEQVRSELGDVSPLPSIEVTVLLLRNDEAAAIELLQTYIDNGEDAAHFRPLLAVLRGDSVLATRLADDFVASGKRPGFTIIEIYSRIGAHDRAKSLLRSIDSLPAGPAILALEVIHNAGADWLEDLQAAPRFKRHLEEARIEPATLRRRR